MQIPGHPRVEIVVPVKNEEHDLGPNIRRLREFLDTAFPFPAEVCIADNGSTDATYELGLLLASELPGVRIVRLEQSGRGRALKQVWSASNAEVLAYMDVDLSTDLAGLLPLVAPLVSGHSDLAIGSRLTPESSVARSPKRELFSRSYNLLLRATFATRIRDAQCGFKALRAEVAHKLLPAVRDEGWFFDTELLLLAERNGLRIHQVPVDWVDDADSRVDVVRTARADLAGVVRMARQFWSGGGRVDLGDAARPALEDDFGRRLVTFSAIGCVSTCVSLVLFLLLHAPLGAVGANAVASALPARARVPTRTPSSRSGRSSGTRFRQMPAVWRIVLPSAVKAATVWSRVAILKSS